VARVDRNPAVSETRARACPNNWTRKTSYSRVALARPEREREKYLFLPLQFIDDKAIDEL